MERLTTDKPVSTMTNYELMHNNCYVSNAEAMYRDHEITRSLNDYIYKLCKMYGFEIPKDDEKIAWVMYDWLENDADDIRHIISALYTMMWSKADLHGRLKRYEDTGLTPDEILHMKANY